MKLQGAVGLHDRAVGDRDRRTDHDCVKAVDGRDAARRSEAVAFDHGEVDRRVLVGGDRVAVDVDHCYRDVTADLPAVISPSDDEAFVDTVAVGRQV